MNTTFKGSTRQPGAYRNIIEPMDSRDNFLGPYGHPGKVFAKKMSEQTGRRIYSDDLVEKPGVKKYLAFFDKASVFSGVGRRSVAIAFRRGARHVHRPRATIGGGDSDSAACAALAFPLARSAASTTGRRRSARRDRRSDQRTCGRYIGRPCPSARLG